MGTITRRTTFAGLATVIAAGALVAGTAVGADAATATATYNCDTNTLLGSYPIPMTLDTSALSNALPTGFEVPGGLVPAGGFATLPAALSGALQYFGLTTFGGSIPSFDLLAGATTIPLVGLVSPDTTLPLTGDATVPFTGAIGGFTAPVPGVYDIALPQTFDLQPPAATGFPATTCVLDPSANPVIGQLNVVKQTSATTAKVRKSGRKYVATASVVRQLQGAGAGSVTAKLAGKKVATKTLSSAGTAVFKLPASAKGSKLVISYAGDALTQASRATTKIK